MTKSNIPNLYDKFCDGTPLMDDDIKELIKHFKPLADLLSKSGPVFKTASIEAGRVVRACELFQEARKQHDRTWSQMRADKL